jgi:hypothetical protein
MGKDNFRTLKNFNGKKSSKKSKKNKNEPSTTEEMRDILDSDSEMPVNTQNFMGKKNNKGLVQYEGDAPYASMNGPMGGMPNMGGMGGMGGMPNMGGMGGMPNMGMPQMNVPNMGMQQMFSPNNYDPLMLQQIAPLQTSQVIQQSGMPGNLLSPSGMISGMSGYSHAGAPSVPQFNMPQQAPQLPMMTGGGYRTIPKRTFTMYRTLL